MSIFLDTIKKTREYLDYVEKHYNNVQKAFKEFTKRTCHKRFNEKYEEFGWFTKLYDDWHFLILQTIIEEHDLSKLDYEEFIPYRKNFYPLNEEEKQLNKDSFKVAWEHHKEFNSHHWQSRVGKTFDKYSGFEGSYYAIENAMDWIAMAYEFNKTPLNKYYLDNKDKIKLSDNDKYVIENVYQIMMDKDLESED